MAGRRIERVNEQLRRELSDVLFSEVKDPRVGRITITAVSVSPDLSHARVFVHRVEADEEVESLFEGLRAATPFLRGELGRRLRLRRVPELAWEWDRSLDYAQHIERLLAQVRRPGDADADEADGGA